MPSSPLTTMTDADVAEVAELMLERDVRSMPVLGNGGIVSRRDIGLRCRPAGRHADGGERVDLVAAPLSPDRPASVAVECDGFSPGSCDLWSGAAGVGCR
jgi:hypothetical protein